MTLRYAKTYRTLLQAIQWCYEHPGLGVTIFTSLNQVVPITLVYDPSKGGWFRDGYLVKPKERELLQLPQ